MSPAEVLFDSCRAPAGHSSAHLAALSATFVCFFAADCPEGESSQGQCVGYSRASQAASSLISFPILIEKERECVKRGINEGG